MTYIVTCEAFGAYFSVIAGRTAPRRRRRHVDPPEVPIDSLHPDMTLSLDSTVRLKSGTDMPRFGLGVYQVDDGTQTVDAITWAFEAGYRHIDTAKLYKNETSVGQAVRDSGIPRDEIWVTTKLFPTDFHHVQSAFDASMKRLGLDYVDLYLVHAPIPGLNGSVWKKMEAIAASGRARSVGVSNFTPGQLSSLLQHANVQPSVNQVKASVFGYNKATYALCRKEGVAYEAYSPLHRGKNLDDVRVVRVAERHGKSAGQILLRWALQMDMVVIPKSTRQSRIVENAEVFDFELSDDDMAQLDAISS